VDTRIDVNFYAKLLVNLTSKGVDRALPGLDLAAGEFPQAAL